MTVVRCRRDCPDDAETAVERCSGIPLETSEGDQKWASLVHSGSETG
jgi:hypothetical protein